MKDCTVLQCKLVSPPFHNKQNTETMDGLRHMHTEFHVVQTTLKKSKDNIF